MQRAAAEPATDPSVAFGDSSPQGGERLSARNVDFKFEAVPRLAGDRSAKRIRGSVPDSVTFERRNWDRRHFHPRGKSACPILAVLGGFAGIALAPDAAKTLGFSGVASVSSEMSARRRAMAVPND